jgi:hypothetical protein
LTLQIIFSGTSLVLCAFFFVYCHHYIRRRTSHENILANYRDEVNRLIADIDAATDRDAQLVEDRIAGLRKLLEDADRRISLLSRDLERRRPGTELYTALGSAPRPVTTPEAAVSLAGLDSRPGGQPVASAAVAAAQPPAAIPDTLWPPPAGVPAGEAQPPAPVAPVAATVPERPLTERVLELSRQGIAPELIATRLKVSLSEVQLALAVSRRAGA